jgi:hypothetical protein
MVSGERVRAQFHADRWFEMAPVIPHGSISTGWKPGIQRPIDPGNHRPDREVPRSEA